MLFADATSDFLAHPLTAVVVGALLTVALGALGRGLRSVLTEVRALRVDLVAHMGAEEALRSTELVERQARQEATDRQMAEIKESVGALRGELRDATTVLHRRIDDALGELAVGNPEVRRG